MDATPRLLDPDARPLSLPNGALKKHRPSPAAAAADLLYRECLKNHAASLGGHVLDGCGEFMPSPAANPADPTSLKCAACGCHRNFHRRLPNLPHRATSDDDDPLVETSAGGDGRRRRASRSPPPYFSSAPHMLLALSTGLPGPTRPPPAAAPSPAAAGLLPRKRFRTKFSTEQKEMMQELSERLGWRMQKCDDGLVEEWCRKIGVSRGVFKVWMHNNKHNFVPGAARRGGGEVGSGSSSSSGGAANAAATTTTTATPGIGGGVVGNGGGVGNSHPGVNGSSSTS